MGHTPGTPCVYEDTEHTGRCSSRIVGSAPVDMARTRYFEVTETRGNKSYWRTNASAAIGNQVEHRYPDGRWRGSFRFETEFGFLASIEGFPWREITAEEVPDASPDPEAA